MLLGGIVMSHLMDLFAFLKLIYHIDYLISAINNIYWAAFAVVFVYFVASVFIYVQDKTKDKQGGG